MNILKLFMPNKVSHDYISSVEITLDFYHVKSYVFGDGCRCNCMYIIAPNISNIPNNIREDKRCHINPPKIKKGLNLIDDYDFILHTNFFRDFYEVIYELKRNEQYYGCNKGYGIVNYMALLKPYDVNPVICGNYIVIDSNSGWEILKKNSYYCGTVLGQEMIQLDRSRTTIRPGTVKITACEPKFRKKYENFLRIATTFCTENDDNSISSLQKFMEKLNNVDGK